MNYTTITTFEDFEKEFFRLLPISSETPLISSDNHVMSFIFRYFRDNFFDGKTDAIERTFNLLDVNKTPLVYLIGISSATNRFKTILKNRSDFIKRVEIKSIDEIGIERTNNIFYGLR